MAKKVKKIQDLSNEVIEVQVEREKKVYLLDDLRLASVSAEDVKNALNGISASYAYWASILADLNSKIRAAEAEYDYWYAGAYDDVDEDKRTESWKKTQIFLVYSKEWKMRIKRKSDLMLTRDKVSALVKALDMQSRVLQTIAALLRVEMEVIKTEG